MSKNQHTTQRYALFMGDRYYPSGGAKDLIETGDGEAILSIKAHKRLEEYTFPWVHIFDLQERKIVREWHYNTDTQQMEEVEPSK